MRDSGFENMATVLVHPAVLRDLELDMMRDDFRVWLVDKAPTFTDPERAAFQIRRNLIEWSQGRWAQAADWTLVWITFGHSWLDGEEPVPWPAHDALWKKLEKHAESVRYNMGLSGMPRLTVPEDLI